MKNISFIAATILLFFASNPAKSRQENEGILKEHKYTNHLIHETSPYLLQHAHNPVNWFSWSDAALLKAKTEDKPIFLSVGYSTCYWCHVMEKDSFEREEVAEILNQHFISIKVDREERPDIDEQYMLATQLVTGRGGWPNSVWLTPDGRPWMAGTYFPRDRFIPLLKNLADVWKNRRVEVEEQANKIADSIRNQSLGPEVNSERPLSQELVDRAVANLRGRFDFTNGGFGSQPKFPPHGGLRILLEEYSRSQDPTLLPLITRTLDAMWLGGMHDHIGGGFHRYSTDAVWLLPHFEKMLYDNAQLMRSYTDAFLLTGTLRYREAVEDIFSWLQRAMTAPEGGFYSAIDSGEVGKEGEAYIWSYAEVIDVLGKDDGELFAQIYNMAKGGNFREESTGSQAPHNIAHLKRPLAEIAKQRGVDPEEFYKQIAQMREKLLSRRNTWEQPHKDDKILTSWNGLMIGALAYAGRQLQEPRYTQAASKAADFLLKNLMDCEMGLLRTYRVGEAKLPGYLDDYAYFAQGLLDLYQASKEPRWLKEAQFLGDMILSQFEDQENGGFYFTSAAHEDLLLRSKSLTGSGNIPSANGLAALVLLELERFTGEERYRNSARQALDALSGLMWQNPWGLDTEIFVVSVLLQKKKPAALPKVNLSVADISQNLGKEVQAQVYSSRLLVKPGERFKVAIGLDIQEGWHLYGANAEVDFLIPTTVSVKGSKNLLFGEIVEPGAKEKFDSVLKKTLRTYEDHIWFLIPIQVRNDAVLGKEVLQLQIRTQACDQSRCLPPRTDELSLQISVVQEDEPETERHSEIFENLGPQDSK